MSAAVVVGGEGVVGSWLKTILQNSGWSVASVDIRGGDLEADGRVTDPRLRDLIREADLVALALPEDATLQVAEAIEPLLGPVTTLVSTASIQSPLFDSPPGRTLRGRLMGCNPMFRPTLGSAGRSVLVVTAAGTDGAVSAPLEEALRENGLVVETLDPAEHDAAMVLAQALPHAALLGVASVLASSQVDPALIWRLAPPPARVLLAGAARILDSNLHVYTDIQRSAGADEMRARLAEGVLTLGMGTTEHLIRTLMDLRSSLEQIVGPAAGVAEALYARLVASPTSGKEEVS